MSLSGTLERGAHHQALDLSEELPPHLHHHANHQQLLHHSNSLASTTAMGGGRETPSRVVIPPPYSAAESGGGGSEAPLELRGSLDCWACSVLVTAQNLVIAAINSCLAGMVFGTILTPAMVMVVFGFLCHSTVGDTGPSPRHHPLLLQPADRRRLRGAAGGGVPLGHPSAGPGAGGVLPPGPTPPAGPVLHPIQPSRVQEPSCHAASRSGHRLLRGEGRRRQGKGVGVRW
nr:transmembrane protein 88 b isoform X1 [Nothobranchius furzeri]